jgi:integrase
MSIYKPKNRPHYLYDFKIRGVRFFGSTGTATKAVARQIEVRERDNAARGRRDRQPMTLDRALGRFFSEVARHQRSSETTFYLSAKLKGGLGAETLLSNLTDDELAAYISRRRGEVAESSVNRETQLLKRVFRRADTVWKADIGDMPNWREHILQEPAGRVRELTADEEARLFDALRPDFHPLIAFALVSGVRLANARTLTWAQVDYSARQITFRIKSRRPGGDVHILPLTSAMVALLAQQKGHHPIYVFTYECKRSRGLRRKGERYPFSRSGWRRDWGKALKVAGIEDFRFHDLRHTAATRTLRATGNLKVVQEQLGHRDIATTARYAHATTGDVREAMERVESRHSPDVAGGVLSKPLTGKG